MNANVTTAHALAAGKGFTPPSLEQRRDRIRSLITVQLITTPTR